MVIGDVRLRLRQQRGGSEYCFARTYMGMGFMSVSATKAHAAKHALLHISLDTQATPLVGRYIVSEIMTWRELVGKVFHR